MDYTDSIAWLQRETPGTSTSRLNEKVIWVCILCRKKQELLSKTGQWINKGMSAGGDAIMRRIQADLQQQPPEELLAPACDKKPKLERAHSAAEKENLPLQRTGSVLRRQYSQQESSTTAGVTTRADEREDDPRFYRREIEGLMRTQTAAVP
uniref:Uncharacterized protein n=1 Tax=Timema poppense TaxID=170557 RepID=A0A7R9CH17_TIMPO|nr:unnamed protein product [Timema poppensis]